MKSCVTAIVLLIVAIAMFVGVAIGSSLLVNLIVQGNGNPMRPAGIGVSLLVVSTTLSYSGLWWIEEDDEWDPDGAKPRLAFVYAWSLGIAAYLERVHVGLVAVLAIGGGVIGILVGSDLKRRIVKLKESRTDEPVVD